MCPNDPRVRFVANSVTDDLVLRDIPDQLDVAFHLACFHGNQSSIADPIADHDNNNITSLKLFERLKDIRSLRKVVYAAAGCAVAKKTRDEPAATSEDAPVELFHDSPYSISKLVGEMYGNYYFRRHKLPFTKARFQNVYGPREILGAGRWRGTPHTVWRNVTPTFVFKALHGEALPLINGGEDGRDFIFVEDLVEGLTRIAAYGEPGEAYNLASGRETRIHDLATIINRLTQNATPPDITPPRDWDNSGRRYGDPSKSLEKLGFSARTELEEGLVRDRGLDPRQPCADQALHGAARRPGSRRRTISSVKSILTVIGARPQFIKAAPVSRALRAHSGLREIIAHTGQHFDREMSEVFFEELALPKPDHHLGVHGGGHGAMTGRMMIALEQLMFEVKPDLVLIYGDTNSTLAGAVVAAKLFLPIAHVEAGLRAFRPIPEEINRILADRVSRWLFCPTPTAVQNLDAEGIRDGVHLVGDVMYDATLEAVALAKSRSTILQRLGLAPGAYHLATIHRAENTDSADALRAVVDYLTKASRECPVVIPLHPRTRQAAAKFGIDLSALRVIEPVGYLDMAALLADCRSVFTDSGGLQKEAYFHRKPCVTLRDATEWIETVEAGWNRLWSTPDFAAPRRDIPDYGDGHAAEKIAQILASA